MKIVLALAVAALLFWPDASFARGPIVSGTETYKGPVVSSPTYKGPIVSKPSKAADLYRGPIVSSQGKGPIVHSRGPIVEASAFYFWTRNLSHAMRLVFL